MSELEFRLLDMRYGLAGSRYFHSRSISDQIDRVGGMHWKGEAGRDGRRGLARIELRGALQNELQTSRGEVIEACRQYLANHPDGDHRDYVLFLLARAHDMRLDLSRVRTEERAHYYEDRVSGSGYLVWSELQVNHFQSPLTIIALTRIGQYFLMRNEIDVGLGKLRQARRRWLEYSAGDKRPQPAHRWLSIFRVQAGSVVTPDIIAERIGPLEHWIWLIEQNSAAGARHNDALADFFNLDPRDPGTYALDDRGVPGTYPGTLEKLIERHKDSLLRDNLSVRLAMTAPLEDRVRRLRQLMNSDATGQDARFEAMAELARLLSTGSPADRQQARAYWDALLSSGGPFVDEARHGLLSLSVSAGPES
jgi:hypothetical protein